MITTADRPDDSCVCSRCGTQVLHGEPILLDPDNGDVKHADLEGCIVASIVDDAVFPKRPRPRLEAAAAASGCVVRDFVGGILVGAANHPHGLALLVGFTSAGYKVFASDICLPDFETPDAERVVAFVLENT